MSLRRRVATLTRTPKAFSIVPAPLPDGDLVIEHVSGVTVRIEPDGRVHITSPSSIQFHAVGDLQLSSDTHIGLYAPRIDLN
jgi:hypothetical protein